MNRVLRAYLVGYSPAANHHLARALKETGRVDVVGSSTLPMLALADIPERAVDVLFLDLPTMRLDGFERLERLPANPPQVVFITRRDEEDAVRALEQSGMPYVTTPVRRRRLGQTLDALEARCADPDREQPHELLERLADFRLSPRIVPYADRIGVYFGPKRIRLLEVTAISHFVANNNVTIAMTPEDAGVVKCQLGELEQRLDPRKFVRIHRGVIVNLDWVEHFEIGVPGMVVRLRGHAEATLKVARERTGSLKERLLI